MLSVATSHYGFLVSVPLVDWQQTADVELNRSAVVCISSTLTFGFDGVSVGHFLSVTQAFQQVTSSAMLEGEAAARRLCSLSRETCHDAVAAAVCG